MCQNGRDFDLLVTILKLLILLLFAYPLIHYGLFTKEPIETPGNETLEHKEEIIRNISRNITVIVQPTCPVSHLQIILAELCQDLFRINSQCAPEDIHNLEKHKIPKIQAKNNTAEPRGTIVGCVAAGLLLTSLGAAFLELYKAKSQTAVKSTKPTMNRKCSLADLTVLKHTRKELVRRESIMEIPENGSCTKQLGFRPPPLFRRCSFPGGPNENSSSSSYIAYRENRGITESRRLSIIESCLNDQSFERRHWTRLVHRH